MGSERYMLLRGQEQELKPGDMFITDRAGIISSILYGPDQRTQIHTLTRNVLFTVYAPASIEQQVIIHHLQEIRQNVLAVAPRAQVTMLKVFGAD
jgi:DNA/RNA-binding domain of Phe-tRNA-synthetase-like protein